MSVVTAAPVELADDQRPPELTGAEKTAFLAAFESTGSLRASARSIDVSRSRVKVSRRRRPQFQGALDAIRVRMLENASDELFWAIDAFDRLGPFGDGAIDELINGLLRPADHMPRRDELDQERLAAARGRLAAAGLEWARAVVQASSAALAEDQS